MCVMCDGASLDECRFDIHGIIDRYGWFIQYVEVEPITRAWAYTIGLSAGFDHPELVITGVRPETAARVLNGIGEMIRDGTCFSTDDRLVDSAERYSYLSAVDPPSLRAGESSRCGWITTTASGLVTLKRKRWSRVAGPQGDVGLFAIVDRLTGDRHLGGWSRGKGRSRGGCGGEWRA